MTRLISDKDRAYILEQLTLAPDNVLVAAFNQWHKERENALLCRENINASRVSELDGPSGSPSYGLKFDSGDNRRVGNVEYGTYTDSDYVSTSRANVSPGNSSITRIGASTRVDLLAILKTGRQPDKKYEEHLKLLWERGEVKFDGKEWWL